MQRAMALIKDAQRIETTLRHSIAIMRVVNSSPAAKVVDNFMVYRDIPPYPYNAVLDFDSVDVTDNGKPRTKEGYLKRLISQNSGDNEPSVPDKGEELYLNVTAVSGMAGSGKTVALQGLAHDTQIQQQYSDGVYYMQFAANASEMDAIEKLAYILKTSGDVQLSQQVLGLRCLTEAVQIAANWFEGKRCLFMCGNIGWFFSSQTGFLSEL